MKSVAVLLLALFAGIVPASAQERLLDAFRIGRACTADIERLCSGIAPGGGRIKACMKEKVGQLSSGCLDAVLGAAVSGKERELKLNPGATPGLVLHTEKARNYAYCEIAPVIETPNGIFAEFYNTTGTTGPTGGCPAAAFAALDAKKLGEKLSTKIVYMNPTPQTARRHWVMDQNWVFAMGETVDFDGVAATWMASMSPSMMLSTIAAPMTPVEIHRQSKYLFLKGSQVFLMRAPDKKVWVMQSYASEVDPALTYDKLPQLGSRLKLPPGWSFEAKTLTEDLTIDPRNADGVAHIIRDELHNVYEGCGFDAACNYVP